MGFLRRRDRNRHRRASPAVQLPGVSEFRLIFKGPAYMILGPAFAMPGMGRAAVEAAMEVEVTDDHRRRWRERVGDWLLVVADGTGPISDDDAQRVRKMCDENLMEAELLWLLGSFPRMPRSGEPDPVVVRKAVEEVAALPIDFGDAERHVWRRSLQDKLSQKSIGGITYEEAKRHVEAGTGDARHQFVVDLRDEISTRVGSGCGLPECPQC